MSETLIIVNHIGTSVVEAIESELTQMVDYVKVKTDMDVVLSFSSQRAIEKIKSKGCFIPSFENALKDGLKSYASIIVMPIHLVGGHDYLNIQEIVNQYQDKVTLLKPLLTSIYDCELFSKVLFGIFKENKEIKILFVGHGTKDESNNYYNQLMAEFSKYNNHWEFMSLEDKVFDYEPNDEVHLFPLFTVGGYHLRKDLFNIKDSIMKKLKTQGVRVIPYEKGLLGYEGIRELYLNQVGSIK